MLNCYTLFNLLYFTYFTCAVAYAEHALVRAFISY